MSKAFKPFNKSSGTSSERTNNLRRKAMYSAITSSQRKGELEQYQETNRNFTVKKCTSPNFSTLNQVRSYKTYMDLSIGKNIVNPLLNGQEGYTMDGRIGSFYKATVSDSNTIYTSPSAGGSPPLPDISNGNGKIAWSNDSQGDTPTGSDQYDNSDNYPGYVVDPYNTFSRHCDTETYTLKNDVRVVTLYGRWLESYWQATGGQYTNGLSFPNTVTFGTQATNTNPAIVNKAAPMTRVPDSAATPSATAAQAAVATAQADVNTAQGVVDAATTAAANADADLAQAYTDLSNAEADLAQAYAAVANAEAAVATANPFADGETKYCPSPTADTSTNSGSLGSTLVDLQGHAES